MPGEAARGSGQGGGHQTHGREEPQGSLPVQRHSAGLMSQLLSGGAAGFLFGFWWIECAPTPSPHHLLVGEGSGVATLTLIALFVTGEFHATCIPFTPKNSHCTDGRGGKFLA